MVLRGEDAIDAVGMSPDNHWLLSGSEDKSARLWDLNAKDPAANPVVLGGHDSQVIAVAISPDNHWLITGSDDKTARLWLPSSERLDESCSYHRWSKFLLTNGGFIFQARSTAQDL